MRRSLGDNDRQASTRSREIEAVTLDATGTLFHCPRLAAIYAETLGRHGLAVDPDRVGELIPVVWRELDCRVGYGEDRFASHSGGSRGFWKGFLQRLCALAGLSAPSRFLAAELYDRFARGESWELYPEVEPVLARLAGRGLRLAVVSNWDERLPGVLAELGVAGRFASVVYSQRVGVEKPHPALFRRALDELGVPPERALHVGDRSRLDVEGATALGMRALLLDRHRTGDGTGVIASLSELQRVLA
ncbi:MAG: HAD-IA family hydrolase [Thermoanaerobaculia bacterium]